MSQRIALGILFAWFFFGSIGHFRHAGFFISIVPPYIPWPRAMVAVSGVFEMLGAIGILLRRTRRAAGIGLFLLTIAVTPANIYMWQHPDLFQMMPPWLLTMRLLVQVLLLATIAWSTWRRPSTLNATTRVAT